MPAFEQEEAEQISTKKSKLDYLLEAYGGANTAQDDFEQEFG